MNKIITIVVAAILVITLGIFAFIKFFPTTNNDKVGTYKGDYDYTVELSDYAFTPNIIEVAAGTTVRILVTNKTGSHDFVIDEFKLKSNVLSAGQEQLISFRVPETSEGQSYQFYCSQYNHRQMGMVGTLKIN